jgi:hydrogenase maturation protease
MSTANMVIGIGNEYRSDDGVGLRVLREVKEKALAGTVLIECTNGGIDLPETWKTASSVILIDAVSSGARPGTIYRLDALAQPIPTNLSFQSTHSFGIAEVIELARILDQLPARLIVYAIEGKDFSMGTALSPVVERSVQQVVAQLTSEIQGGHQYRSTAANGPSSGMSTCSTT